MEIRSPKTRAYDNVEQIKDAIEKLSSIGATKATIASVLMVSRQTVYAWLDRGREVEQLIISGESITEVQQEFLDILDAYTRGRGVAAKVALRRIDRIANEVVDAKTMGVALKANERILQTIETDSYVSGAEIKVENHIAIPQPLTDEEVEKINTKLDDEL